MAERADAVPAAAENGSAERDHTRAQTTARKRPESGVRLALATSACIVVALAGLLGWLGFRTVQPLQAAQQRELFLQAGRQGALDLTSVNYAEVDADVRRILERSTGTFHDDFQTRSQPFVDVVKRNQSKRQGSIIEAGLQSVTGDSARVLVVVSVKTSNAGVDEPQPHSFRMRIDVQKMPGGVKVSNVEFMP